VFGTLTLKGVQNKNLFVSENGSEYKLVNSWVTPPNQVEKFVLLRKFNDNSWFVLRDVVVK